MVYQVYELQILVSVEKIIVVIEKQSIIGMIVIKTYFGAVVLKRCDVSTCYDRSVVTGRNVASFQNNRSKVSFNYYHFDSWSHEQYIPYYRNLVRYNLCMRNRYIPNKVQITVTIVSAGYIQHSISWINNIVSAG